MRIVYAALLAISMRQAFCGELTIWSSRPKWITVTTQNVNFGRTVDIDDPIQIILLEATSKLTTIPFSKDITNIYQKAKLSEPSSFFDSSIEFLVCDASNEWFYIWYEPRGEPHPRLMLFPAEQVSRDPLYISATAFGYQTEDPDLIEILRPFTKSK